MPATGLHEQVQPHPRDTKSRPLWSAEKPKRFGAASIEDMIALLSEEKNRVYKERQEKEYLYSVYIMGQKKCCNKECTIHIMTKR